MWTTTNTPTAMMARTTTTSLFDTTTNLWSDAFLARRGGDTAVTMLTWVPREDMVADYLTKALQGAEFRRFQDLIMGNV
jgi:hypothetical protein